jgi:hypothetical protein
MKRPSASLSPSCSSCGTKSPPDPPDPKSHQKYRSSRPPGSLQIVHSAERKVVVYYSFQIRNVEPSGSQVSAHHDVVLAVSKELVILKSGVLMELTMQSKSVDSLALQKIL